MYTNSKKHQESGEMSFSFFFLFFFWGGGGGAEITIAVILFYSVLYTYKIYRLQLSLFLLQFVWGIIVE